MLARVAEKIPTGPEWLYEPKWDGFRAIVLRDGDKVHIGSRNQHPLERYFPEVVDIAFEAFPERCVVDGEIVIEGEAGLDFDALLQRIHPAASRVRLLAQETPGTYIGFDLLAEETDLRTRPLGERRERLVKTNRDHRTALVTPQTSDPDEAGRWFDQFEGAGLDGVVAKRTDGPYVEGELAPPGASRTSL
jgi:ATP-dependent DNA ligase